MNRPADVWLGLLALLILSSCLGIGHNRFSQAPLPLWFPPPVTHPWDVDLPSVREAVHLRSTVLFDARSSQRYLSGHLPGARHLPFEQASLAAPTQLSAENQVIVYCDNPGCPKADAVRLLLLQKGFKQVKVFRGGIAAWTREGLELEK